MRRLLSVGVTEQSRGESGTSFSHFLGLLRGSLYCNRAKGSPFEESRAKRRREGKRGGKGSDKYWMFMDRQI